MPSFDGNVLQEWKDMVHDPEVGAIVVGSPTPFHAEQIIEAAKLGKHIFCEKVSRACCHAKSRSSSVVPFVPHLWQIYEIYEGLALSHGVLSLMPACLPV